MAEPMEAQLARLDERMNTMLQRQDRAEDSRKEQYKQNEQILNAINNLSGRLTAVEHQLTSQQPTIAEFITLKQKVVGAGKLGRWLWVLGASIIGLVYTFREKLRIALLWLLG